MDLGKLPFRLSGRDPSKPVIGIEQQQLVDMLHGKHYSDVLAGRVFSQSTTILGLALPIYTGTAAAGGLPIFNPPNSGVNLEMISVDIARTSGTSAFGAIGLIIRALNAIATGALLTAHASVSPVNALFGSGNASKVLSTNGAGASTVTAAAVTDFIRTLFSMNLEADTATAHAATIARYDFDGTLVIPPGNLCYLAATLASVALYATTIVWKEVPVLPNMG